jgi:hypothetical protein
MDGELDAVMLDETPPQDAAPVPAAEREEPVWLDDKRRSPRSR